MTAEDYEKAKELFLTNNYSLTKIGELLKIDRKKLSKQLKADGLYRGKSYDNKTIEEAVRLLNEGNNITAVCKELGVDRFAFGRKLRELGILEEKHPSKNHNVKVDYDGEWATHMINDYRSKMSKWDIMSKYNISEQVFYNVLRYHKVERKNNRKISIEDEMIFNVIDTQEKAYWLGFLYADGYICEDNSTLEIALKESDKEHIEAFKAFMRTDAKIVKRTSTYKGKVFNSYRLTVCSKQIVEDLVFHGCYQNKSLTLEFPKTVPSYLIRHFIRGYFDGDGSVCLSNGYNCVSFVGTDNMLCWIQQQLKLSPKKLQKCGKAYQFSFKAEKDVTNTYHYFYDDAAIYLLRKKAKFVFPSVVNVDKCNNRLLESNIGEVVQI